MISNYKKIRALSLKEMKKDSFYGQILSHPVATFIVCLIENTKITPNFITFFSLLIALSGTYFIGFDKSYMGLIYGFLLLHFALILDSVDGQLARWKNKMSSFGGYFDGLIDHVKHRIIPISIVIRYIGQHDYIFLVGIIVIALHSLAFYENQSRIIIDLKNKEIKTKREEATKKIFGNSKLKKALANLQVELHGYYLYLAIFFLINKPIYLLYFIGLNSLFLLSKRFLVFYISSINK